MKKSLQTAVVSGLVSLAFVALVIVLLRSFPGLRSFTVGAGDGGLTLTVNAEGRFEIRSFLDNLVADTTQSADWARDDLVSWSREHLGLLAVSDARLIDELAKLCPQANLDEITEYQAHVEACEQHVVVRELRRRSLGGDPPFQPNGREVRIGTPPTPPQPGQAFTCYGSVFENRRVLISVDGSPNALEVIARGGYSCPQTGRYPDLQISAQDAQQLYGRPTREYETAIALVAL